MRTRSMVAGSVRKSRPGATRTSTGCARVSAPCCSRRRHAPLDHPKTARQYNREAVDTPVTEKPRGVAGDRRSVGEIDGAQKNKTTRRGGLKSCKKPDELFSR